MSIFSDDKIDIAYEDDLKREVKSEIVLVDPKVISEFSLLAASNPSVEKAALLSGRLEGKYMIISGIHECKKAKSTAATVELDKQEIIEISDSLPKNSFIIGWQHSHPSYGVFMSSRDVDTQKEFQSMFSDAIACVLDPFSKGKIEFGFFRLENGEPKKMEYKFLVRRDLSFEKTAETALIAECDAGVRLEGC